jgi:hypothetical protein
VSCNSLFSATRSLSSVAMGQNEKIDAFQVNVSSDSRNWLGFIFSRFLRPRPPMKGRQRPSPDVNCRQRAFAVLLRSKRLVWKTLSIMKCFFQNSDPHSQNRPNSGQKPSTRQSSHSESDNSHQNRVHHRGSRPGRLCHQEQRRAGVLALIWQSALCYEE